MKKIRRILAIALTLAMMLSLGFIASSAKTGEGAIRFIADKGIEDSECNCCRICCFCDNLCYADPNHKRGPDWPLGSLSPEAPGPHGLASTEECPCFCVTVDPADCDCPCKICCVCDNVSAPPDKCEGGSNHNGVPGGAVYCPCYCKIVKPPIGKFGNLDFGNRKLMPGTPRIYTTLDSPGSGLLDKEWLNVNVTATHIFSSFASWKVSASISDFTADGLAGTPVLNNFGLTLRHFDVTVTNDDPSHTDAPPASQNAVLEANQTPEDVVVFTGTEKDWLVEYFNEFSGELDVPNGGDAALGLSKATITWDIITA